MTNGTLTAQTKIQVGLAITLAGAASGMYVMVYNMNSSLSNDLLSLRDKIEAHYIPKDLFTSEIASLRRERELQFLSFNEKLDAQALRLTEVKSEVTALRAGR